MCRRRLIFRRRPVRLNGSLLVAGIRRNTVTDPGKGARAAAISRAIDKASDVATRKSASCRRALGSSDGGWSANLSGTPRELGGARPRHRTARRPFHDRLCSHQTGPLQHFTRKVIRCWGFAGGVLQQLLFQAPRIVLVDGTVEAVGVDVDVNGAGDRGRGRFDVGFECGAVGGPF